MSKRIETFKEFEEHWGRLEQEFLNWIDQVIYKAGIDKKECADEIHQVKLWVGRLMENRVRKLIDKFFDEGIIDSYEWIAFTRKKGINS
ncbi:hypothetical protein ACIJDO_000211 [Enterococcus hirae]